MKKSNKIWWILGGIVVALVIFLIVGKQAGWIGKEKPTEVELTKVSKSDITETVSASGKVQPEVEVKITPDVPGEIIGLYIKEGDSVKKGQLLLKIKPENYLSVVERAEAVVNQTKASVEQAKSGLAQAEVRVLKATMEFNRQKKLFDDKVISASEYEVAETNLKVAKQDVEASKANIEAANFNVKSAQAGLKDASENLRKTNVYAPMSGIVSKLAVELGERVVGTSQMAGTEMLRIADLSNMEVRVNVNENDIVRVSLKDTVIIDVDAYTSSGKKFKGIVTEIANTANGVGGTLAAASTSTDAVTEFEVRIRILPQSYSDLVSFKTRRTYPFKPGMTATVEIVTEKKEKVLSVPIAAVTTRSEKEEAKPEKNDDGDNNQTNNEPKATKKEKPKEVVFVYQNDKVKMREVKTGITDTVDGTIEIKEGLKEGEEIVSGPYIAVSKTLKNDMIVTKKGEKKEKK
jgi:HlyD family secretion protein